MESVDRYFAGWNETDPAARLALVTEAFGEGSSYIDPQADVRGRQEIADMMGVVQATFPGHRSRSRARSSVTTTRAASSGRSARRPVS